MSSPEETALREQVEQLKKLVAGLETQVADLLAINTEQAATIAHLQEVNRSLLRWRFGRRTEKVDDDGQLLLPLQGLSCDVVYSKPCASAPPAAKAPASHKRKRMLWSVLCPQLPVVERRIEIPEAERFDLDGTPLVPQGVETREEIVYTPGSNHILRTVRQRYGRPDTGEKIKTAPNPPCIVSKGGLADETILAMVTHHAMDCLPYQRIAEMISRLGAPISRGLVTRSCNTFAALATPLLDAMQQQIQEADVLHIDGSFIFHQDRQRTRRCSRKPLYAITDGNQVVLRWRDDERHETAADLIPGYRGYLVRDEWKGWYKLKNAELTHIACNAHARRYFAQHMDSDADARRIVGIYTRLYQVERHATETGLTGPALYAKRHALRQQYSVAIMDELHAEATRLTQTRTGDCLTAAQYILNHASELRKFLTSGAIPVDNNLAERVLRRNAMLRKNRLFYVQPESGQHIGTMLSLMGSCRLLGLNPLDYLTWSLPALLAHRDAPELAKPSLAAVTPRAYAASLNQPATIAS